MLNIRHPSCAICMLLIVLRLLSRLIDCRRRIRVGPLHLRECVTLIYTPFVQSSSYIVRRYFVNYSLFQTIKVLYKRTNFWTLASPKKSTSLASKIKYWVTLRKLQLIIRKRVTQIANNILNYKYDCNKTIVKMCSEMSQ